MLQNCLLDVLKYTVYMSEHLLPLVCGFMWFGFIRNALTNQFLVRILFTDLLMVNDLRLV